MPVEWWMDKRMWNEILFDHEKEWNADAFYYMIELWKYYTKWMKLITRDHILYDFFYIKCPELVTIERKKVDGLLHRDWGWRIDGEEGR